MASDHYNAWNISKLSPNIACSTPICRSTAFKINSFIFLDLETSHLESSDRPTIIEISLIAIHRTGLLHPDVLASLEHAQNGISTWDLSKLTFPRVADKLTLCLDPRKHTSPATFNLTRLDNLNLNESKKMPFDDGVVSMLNLFFTRQEAPMCLVAHNGSGFDFPLLRTELARLTEEHPFQGLFCIDTLEAFRADFATSCENTESSLVTKKRKAPSDDIRFEESVPDKRDMRHCSGNQINRESPSNACAILVSRISLEQRSDDAPDEIGPVLPNQANSAMALNPTVSLSSSSRRSPPPPPVKSQNPHQYNHSVCKPPKISNGLINIFKRTFCTVPPTSHAAEDDVISLIKVLLPRVCEFVEWADKKAAAFDNVQPYYKPLKPRRKLQF